MLELSENEEDAQRYAKAGIARAGEFTWGRSADILEEAYLHALGTTL